MTTKTRTVKFNTSRKEAETIIAIVHRAVKLSEQILGGVRNWTNQEMMMDVTACHVNAIPLDLDGLLVASDADFCHDVYGIRRHLDRKTGQLRDCFCPRYSR